MIISDQPSPNFDERSLPISVLVLHYTGMESGAAAIKRMCDPAAKVSAHYVVEENGHVLGLVAESKRAWHAGVSCWNGVTDLNSASIGIEIVNGGHDFGLPDFPTEQINTVIALSRAIIERHAISPFNIVGHSDIAPLRKSDPGERFPWAQLADAGIGFIPQSSETDKRILFEAGMRAPGVAVMQRGLSHIGYEVSVTGEFDETTSAIICAFQRRYRQSEITGFADIETLALINALVSMKS